MGIYFDHRFEFSGPSHIVTEFSQKYFKTDDDGRPVDFRYDVFEIEILDQCSDTSPIDSHVAWSLEILTKFGSEEIEIVNTSDAHIEIKTCLKSIGLNFIVKHLHQQMPELDVRLFLCDTDWQGAMLVSSSKGVYREEELEITDEIVTAFEGQPYEINQASTLPSQCKPSPPFKFFTVWKRRRLGRAIADYPVYMAPHPGYLPTLLDEQVEANFAHFMRTREQRIQNVIGFLSDFKIKLDPSLPHTKELDRWIWKYGAFLTPRETGMAIRTHNPVWTGPWRGLNVVFDIATLLGEWIVQRNQNYKWGLNKDVQPGLRNIVDTYRQTTILRDEPFWTIPVFDSVADSCAALRERSLRQGEPRISMGKQYLESVASRILARPADQNDDVRAFFSQA